MKFKNPVVPGFHPDPSVCRVGEDYYLVTSSFEYFPGVPLFHSRDLVHWQQIGYCLTRRSQLPLGKHPSSKGIYAPTIRYQDGTFYMITTNSYGGGHFLVHTRDPRGEWSDPIWIDAAGIDPSLFFDDDGKVYFSHTGRGGGISQCEIDVATGRLLGDPYRVIWRGTGGPWPEGPHLYKINGTYYLMIAEGGTSYGHMETIARSDSPWGPFEPCPRNPILTHRDSDDPIQCTGHADLVQAHDGGWWLICLATRTCNRHYHHLGRETYLAPVRWDADGWPIVGEGGRIASEMDAPFLPAHPVEEEPTRDDFDESTLRTCWNFVRNPRDEDWSLADRPGWLRLTGSAVTLKDQASPAWIGRRQRHFDCRIRALVDFAPQHDHEEAGLTIRMNDQYHYDFAIVRREGGRRILLRREIRWTPMTTMSGPIPDGPVTLEIRADRNEYAFYYAVNGQAPTMLGRAETRYVSTEVAGGYTGVYVAMYATGNGRKSTAPAFFDWFDYVPCE